MINWTGIATISQPDSIQAFTGGVAEFSFTQVDDHWNSGAEDTMKFKLALDASWGSLLGRYRAYIE